MSKFVIYTPDNKDYLVGQTAKGAGWSDDIKNAHFFKTLHQAEFAAKSIVAEMANHDAPYKVCIQEVKDRHGRWRVVNG